MKSVPKVLSFVVLYGVSLVSWEEKLRKAEPFSVTSKRTGDTLDKIHFLRCIFTIPQFTGYALKNPLSGGYTAWGLAIFSSELYYIREGGCQECLSIIISLHFLSTTIIDKLIIETSLPSKSSNFIIVQNRCTKSVVKESFIFISVGWVAILYCTFSFFIYIYL